MTTEAKVFPRILLASNKDDWQTPRERLFDRLVKPFRIELDPCTSHDNPLGCKYIITKERNGITSPWLYNAFVNPPYNQTKEFMAHAVSESKANKTTNVFLCAARTDTKAMQEIGFVNARAVCFIKGRLKFGNSKNSATFPSCLLIFSPRALNFTQLTCLQALGYTFT